MKIKYLLLGICAFVALNTILATPTRSRSFYLLRPDDSTAIYFTPGAFPRKIVYATDEYDKRTVRLHVTSQGYLDSLSYFAELGEYNNAVDLNGNLYIADGQIFIYDQNGKQKGFIEVPERPVTVCLGGKERKTLYITTRSSLYSLSIN